MSDVHHELRADGGESRSCGNEDVTPQEEWEQNNDSFNYEPPQKDPEMWSSDDYTELYDRAIGRRVQWTCDKCCKPFGSLRKARRHVRNRHSEQLIQQAESRIDIDEDDAEETAATDGGRPTGENSASLEDFK